jgi:hypothetical protein
VHQSDADADRDDRMASSAFLLPDRCTLFTAMAGVLDQFLRLRDAIEERASRKFFERPVHAEGPVVLRFNDFFK